MRVKKSFTRKTGLRDARLIIIATEGEKTERMYFQGIASKYRKSSVHVEVLERSFGDGNDPQACLEALNKFTKQYKLRKIDELWLVCDVDRWGSKKLASVNSLCKQKGFHLAVSNPCFELWLLIHFREIAPLSSEERAALCSSCANIAGEIRRALGSYNKANLNFDDFFNGVDLAVSEGNKLDNEAEAWPNNIGSKVFNLINSISR